MVLEVIRDAKPGSAAQRKKEGSSLTTPMASICKWRNKHHVANSILFFKIILAKTLQDGKLKIPNSFARKYGDGLSNPVFLKPQDGTEWKVYWTKHDGQILLQKGWKEFATYYALDHGHLVLFEYNETSHFEVHICDMSGLEIDYPFHGTKHEKDNLEQISDEAVEMLDEMPPSQNNRLKSPMSSPQPCKKLRTGTAGDVRISYNSQNLPLLDQINEDIGGMIQFPELRQSTKGTETLNKATTSKSKRNPSFMMIMKPSYVDSHSMNVPKTFGEKYLKIKRGTAILQVLDGRTWSVTYNVSKFYAGWKRFASDNNLNVGDICVFELTNRRGLYFKVSISPYAQEPSCPLSQVRKKTQRTSMVISPLSETNGALKEAEKFTSENPFFMVNILPCFLGQRRPHIPDVFIKKYLNETHIVTLQFGKKLWRIKLLRYTTYTTYRYPIRLSRGWSLFARESELQAGDVCIFELVDIEDALFDVHFFRCHC